MLAVAEIILFTVLLAVAGIVFTTCLTGWAIATAVRGVVRALSGGVHPRSPVFGPVAGHCPRYGCGVVNPREARFCRRCGQPLVGRRPYMRYRPPSPPRPPRIPTW